VHLSPANGCRPCFPLNLELQLSSIFNPFCPAPAIAITPSNLFFFPFSPFFLSPFSLSFFFFLPLFSFLFFFYSISDTLDKSLPARRFRVSYSYHYSGETMQFRHRFQAILLRQDGDSEGSRGQSNVSEGPRIDWRSAWESPAFAQIVADAPR